MKVSDLQQIRYRVGPYLESNLDKEYYISFIFKNNEFIDNYFNETEKRRIEKMNCNDRVFCLSIEDVDTIFKCNCFVLSLDKSINSLGASWWLRSKGENSDYRSMYVDSTGHVDELGDFVNLNNGVRPAL